MALHEPRAGAWSLKFNVILMGECVHRWMISYEWMSFFMDEFHSWIGVNK